jgi:hypothetical protein
VSANVETREKKNKNKNKKKKNTVVIVNYYPVHRYDRKEKIECIR